MNDVITSRLDVWPCVATRKDKVLSCTAVKVAPFFSSVFFSFFFFLHFTAIVCFHGKICISNYVIAQRMKILFGGRGLDTVEVSAG